MSRIKLWTVLAEVLLSVGLAGCGGGGDEKLPQGPSSLSDGAQTMTYAMGTFGDPRVRIADQQRYATQLSDAGFSTVIHAFVHVYPDASLVLNDTTIIYPDGTPNSDLLYLKDIYDRIKSSGKVRQILVSIGGGGGPPAQTDYNYSRIFNYVNLYPNLEKNPVFRNLLALRANFGMDGIDLNFEPTGYAINNMPPVVAANDQFADLLTKMTLWAKGHGMIVFATPWQHPDFWVKVLQRTRSADGKQLVDSLNIQTYGGDDYHDFVDPMKLVDLGIANVENFVGVGYWCQGGDTANDVFSKISTLRKDYPGLNRAFMWQYGSMLPEPPVSACASSAKEYAQAILDATKD